MKKYTFVVTSALSVMLLLSACNSTEDSNPVNEEETTGSVNEQTNTQNSATDSADTTVDDSTEEATPSNNTIQYVKNGEQKEVETTMTQSPEQDYEIALAQGFSVVGEDIATVTGSVYTPEPLSSTGAFNINAFSLAAGYTLI